MKKILVDYRFIFSLIQNLYPSVVTPASHTLTSEGQNKRAEPLQITVGDDDDGGGGCDDDDDDNADAAAERQEEKKGK